MTAVTSGAPTGEKAGSLYPLRWPATIVMLLAALMDLVDGTIVNVALPTMRADLGASAAQIEWVVSAYMLAFAAVLITAGSLGDLLGRKRLFLLGTAAFALASLGAGLAGTPTVLIAARVVQGVAAGVMTPQLLATFRVIFDDEERGSVFGMYGAVLGFASAIGLLLGGVIIKADLFGSSWRAIFYVNLPIALVALIAGARLIPETRIRSARRPDALGALLLSAALVAIVYPLLEGRTQGWPAWSWGMLAGGVLALGGLGIVEQRRSSTRHAPLVRTQLFRVPAFTAGLTIQLVFSAGMQGFFVIFAVWVQTGQHYSPLRAGLTGVAFSVGSFLLAPVAVPLARQYGRLVLLAGALILAAGILGVDVGAHHVGSGNDPWPLVPGLAVAGAGLALLIIPLVNVVLAVVPAEVAGGASGLFSTAQQLGGAIGVAVIGTVFFGDIAHHSLRGAFIHTAPAVAIAFGLCAALSLLLPRTALADADTLEQPGELATPAAG